MSYYVGRRLQSRLQRLERLLNATNKDALCVDMSNEELADRMLGLRHMAESIKELGLTDPDAQEVLRNAARMEALLSGSAPAKSDISTNVSESGFGAGAAQQPASKRRTKGC